MVYTRLNIMPHKILIVLITLGGWISSVTLAQEEDHPLISRFPDSEVVDVEFVEDANYRLVLGTLQRTRGVVVPENSERLRGDVTKLRYEISQEFTGDDVFEFFQQQFADSGYDMLFTCSGRECGSSNYWANDIFRNRVLYGPERNQHFMALQAGDAHLVLYIITRGNRRTYAYLEIVEEEGAAPEISLPSSELLASIADTGSIAIPGLSFINDRQLEDTQVLADIASELAANTELQLYVVAHLSGSQELEQLLNRSTARAQTVRQQLINLGVEANRLVARGLGPLAPSCAGDNCRERVELVIR
ncbi:MAG: DUF4892 domain-containing protein [Pseudomonadales bacterium]|nr:DUF4892 domain-containing protein [Pseudomonadales bacterium]